jgi:hypothetical protein
MTQIGRVVSHAAEDCRRWCSWVMRWKTCRPLRRRLACRYFCQEGDDPEATRTFHEIARLTGAPIAGSIQAQAGSWASSFGRVAGYVAGGRRFWRVAMSVP